jgi:hypothetical protein
MSSQQFFGISLIIGLILVVVFLYPWSKQSPSRLKLGFRRNLPDLPGASGISPEARQAEQEVKMGFHFEPDSVAKSKSLNVIFNYNGHSWDAFEVLGIPAGSKQAAVEEAFRIALKNTDKTSHDFIRTAFDAIKKTR